MRKIICTLIMMLFSMTTVSAESLNRAINSLGINKSALSVSIRDVKDGDTIYSLNDRTPRLPASTLKIITTSAVQYTLGNDYQYKTELYKSTNNDLYLKLSGDPLLTTSDLEKLLETAREKGITPKTFYIDDSAFDNVEWGEGWQWDDELNPLMPRFSIYNINSNLIDIEIAPTNQNSAAKIKVKPFYPITFINQVISDAKGSNKVLIKRNEDIAPNMFSVEGAISRATALKIPVLNPKINFRLRLEDAINKKKFEYYSPIKNSILPNQNIYLKLPVQFGLMTKVLRKILLKC